MREFLDLANNPIFVKHVRSRLRKNALLPGIIVIAFLSLCIIWLDSQMKNPMQPDPAVGSQMFFWLQGLILVLMGGSQVATAMAYVKDTGIIDFHRVTPIPARVQTIGFMVGAPIRELLLYAVTLPFAAYMAISGPIGIANFCKLVLVQLSGAMMYFSLAMITGLSARTGKGASGRFVAFIAGLNIMANVFFPMGVYGPTLLTSIPVYREVFVDDEDAPAQKQQRARQARLQQQQQQQFGAPNQGKGKQGGVNQPVPAQPQVDDDDKPNVTFYSLPLPLVVQSLMFQGTILIFFFMAASRRVNSARLPLYTKPIGITFLAALSFLTLGSLWSSPEVALTLGSIYFLTFCGVLLSSSLVVPLGDVNKGLQRARKLSSFRVPLWSDLASNKAVVFFFGCIIAVTVALGILLAPKPPMLGIFQLNNLFSPWPPLAVGVLALFSFGFAQQYFHLCPHQRSYFGLFVFLAWIAPIAIGAIGLASRIEQAGYIMGMSPIIGISFAGMAGAPRIDPVTLQIACIAPVAICSALFFALLLGKERETRDEVVEEHRTRRHPTPE